MGFAADRGAPESRKCPGSTEAFQAAYSFPELNPVADTRNGSPARDLTEEVKSFALSHEADDVGITSMDPLYVFEGYAITHPRVDCPRAGAQL